MRSLPLSITGIPIATLGFIITTRALYVRIFNAVKFIFYPTFIDNEMKEGTEKLAEKLLERLGTCDIEAAREVTKNLRVKRVWAILNKVDSPKMESVMREKLKEKRIEPIGSIRYDPEVSGSFLKSIPLRESGVKDDVEKIVNRLEGLVTG